MPYSSLELLYKYVWYYFTSSNAKGHGVHSPFVFEFITQVLNDKRNFYCFESIEKIRQQLLLNEQKITVEDFGAGSHLLKTKERQIHKIAKSSLKSPKFAQLLFKIIHKYYSSQSFNIVELGTSFGTTTSYMALANPNNKVFTFEGANAIAKIASTTFQKLSINNINITTGSFQETLETKLQEIEQVDVAFIDGNHQKEATLQYFQLFLKKSNTNSLFIFDDIYWSKGMEEAWQEIKKHPSVTLTIDLFFIGLVYFRKENKVKQHFKIKY